MAVVEDYDYEADKGHDQDNLTGAEPACEDLPQIGTWGQKEDAADVKFGEVLKHDQKSGAAIDGPEVQRDNLRSSRLH